MTKKERVIRAIEYNHPDIIPWAFGLTQDMMKKLIDYSGNPRISETFDNHILQYDISSIKEVNPGYFQDHFDVVWNRTIDKDIGVVDEYRLKKPEISAISQMIPPVPIELIHNKMNQLQDGDEDLFKVIGIGFSLFERAWTLRGMDNLLMDMVVNEEFAHSLFHAITDWNIACMEQTFQYNYDGFYFGDDWGMQKGLIMGPKLWRKFIKPGLKRMYDKAHRYNKYVLQHSCGDISEVYPDLIEIGLNVHQTFQPEIYDIKRTKEQYYGRLAFWGGISTQQILPFAAPHAIKEETRRIMNVFGKGGGLIIAPTHCVPGDVPPENIIAMLEVFKEQKSLS